MSAAWPERIVSGLPEMTFRNAAKQAFQKVKPDHVFGQSRKPGKMFRAGLYARVSTNDQQTLPMQSRALREYAARRGWTITVQVREVGSGTAKREAREKLLAAARRREIRCSAGVAPGPLGPVGNGSFGNASGTRASRSRLRVADRGAGPDYTRRSSDGGAAGRLRRFRAGDPE